MATIPNQPQLKDALTVLPIVRTSLAYLRNLRHSPTLAHVWAGGGGGANLANPSSIDLSRVGMAMNLAEYPPKCLVNQNPQTYPEDPQPNTVSLDPPKWLVWGEPHPPQNRLPQKAGPRLGQQSLGLRHRDARSLVHKEILAALQQPRRRARRQVRQGDELQSALRHLRSHGAWGKGLWEGAWCCACSIVAEK